MRITAAVTEEKGAPFVLQELELGELRLDEVLVEVGAAGICHTDLICRDQWYPVPPDDLMHQKRSVARARTPAPEWRGAATAYFKAAASGSAAGARNANRPTCRNAVLTRGPRTATLAPGRPEQKERT